MTKRFTCLVNPLDHIQNELGGCGDASSESLSSAHDLPASDDTMPEVHSTASTTTDVSASPPSSPPASSGAVVPFKPPQFTTPVGPCTLLNSTATPLDFFMLLFDQDIIQLLVDQTNLYASQNPPGARYKWHDTSANEIKLFLGIVIAMGIHRLLQLEDYWSCDVLLGVPGIVNGMPIDRFKVLQQCLHISDNTTMRPRDDPEYDRLHKVRPLLTATKANFLREYRPHREVCVWMRL